MGIQRTTVLLVCAFTVFLSAVAALVFRQARGESVESTLWVNVVLILLGLLLLTRAKTRPATIIVDRCSQCGGPTFETARSSDRHQVRTCFNCGNEQVATPGLHPGPPLSDPASVDAPEPAREPLPYPGR